MINNIIRHHKGMDLLFIGTYGYSLQCYWINSTLKQYSCIHTIKLDAYSSDSVAIVGSMYSGSFSEKLNLVVGLRDGTMIVLQCQVSDKPEFVVQQSECRKIGKIPISIAPMNAKNQLFAISNTVWHISMQQDVWDFYPVELQNTAYLACANLESFNEPCLLAITESQALQICSIQLVPQMLRTVVPLKEVCCITVLLIGCRNVIEYSLCPISNTHYC